MPLPFLGKREDLRKFWHNCSIYITINDEIYNTDKRQIAFVLSLLTQGKATSWKEQLMEEAMINCKKWGIPLDFSTFAVFEINFFEVFKPFNETDDAWAEMTELKFDGWTGHMDKHVAHFKSLLKKTGMMDLTAIIDCFRETLPRELQQKIILLLNMPKTLTD